MKVLIIGQNTKIANVFNRIADQVFMVVDNSIAHYRSYKENQLYSIIYTTTNITKITSIFYRYSEIKKWIDDYEIDVVFSNEKYSMIAAKLAIMFSKRKNVILLSTSHNSYAWINPRNVKIFSRLIRCTTDGYVALASFVSKQLQAEGVDKNRVLLLPNTIENELFHAKDNYSIENNLLKIAYTAVIYEGKGQHLLIESANLLKKKGLNFHIDFYGEVADFELDYKKRLDELIIKYDLTDQISFKGKVENEHLRSILPSYDLYTCVSLMEMSPLNVLEAKACGLPIIATNVGGIPDLITNMEDGILLKDKSYEELADKILELYTNIDLRQKLGKNALTNVSTIHSATDAAKKLQDFISYLATVK